MPLDRFPKRRYIRTLDQMVSDLGDWKVWYGQSAASANREVLRWRYLDRSAVLETAIGKIRELRATIDALPRLS